MKIDEIPWSCGDLKRVYQELKALCRKCADLIDPMHVSTGEGEEG